MQKKYLGIILFLIIYNVVSGQRKEIRGRILNEDAEGIHIINKTANLFTIADKNGIFFINAAIGDILVLSSVQYDLKVITLDQKKYIQGKFNISLKENLTELEDVIVGMQLSGDLNKDVKSVIIEKSISPEDVGIPEYHGVQEEKIVPIYKAITPTRIDIEAMYKHFSGYYKTLKATRKMDKENKSLEAIKSFYGKRFLLATYSLPKDKLHEFLLFCVETSTIESEFKNSNHNNVLQIFSSKRKEFGGERE